MSSPIERAIERGSWRAGSRRWGRSLNLSHLGVGQVPIKCESWPESLISFRGSQTVVTVNNGDLQTLYNSACKFKLWSSRVDLCSSDRHSPFEQPRFRQTHLRDTYNTSSQFDALTTRATYTHKRFKPARRHFCERNPCGFLGGPNNKTTYIWTAEDITISFYRKISATATPSGHGNHHSPRGSGVGHYSLLI